MSFKVKSAFNVERNKILLGLLMLESIFFAPSVGAEFWRYTFDGGFESPYEYVIQHPFATKEEAAEYWCDSYNQPDNPDYLFVHRVKDVYMASDTDNVRHYTVLCETVQIGYDDWRQSGGSSFYSLSPCYYDWLDKPCSSSKNFGGFSCDQGPSPMTSHPVNMLTGNKFYHEVDYSGSDEFPLEISRYYNSELGQWRHKYDRTLFMLGNRALAYRPDGKVIEFAYLGNGLWKPDPGVTLELKWVPPVYHLIDSDDTVESYSNTYGVLESISTPSGVQITFSRSENNLTATHVNGQSLIFKHDTSGRLIEVEVSESEIYRYGYDSEGRLVHVAYPDKTPGVAGSNPFGEDNPYRSYSYADSRFSNYITSITDELGDVLSAVKYDSEGRAIQSELALNADRIQLDYTHLEDSTDPRVKVTNALGKDTTYHYTTLHGVRKITHVKGHTSTNCAAANKAYSYDANGFVASETDWEGNTTTYTRDNLGRELTRTEAAGTSEEKLITTELHNTYSLPKKVTTSNNITEYSYDSAGRLLNRVVTSAENVE
ncbi:DUF6531 domain-containing protein [Microbulbifer sp. SSSA002]|uniref:DUF6531 domain-containing protein n=1 Tax=Microbulbifer sp. SSSA002 TaxID=3243376 RepID=UPI004039CA5E